MASQDTEAEAEATVAEAEEPAPEVEANEGQGVADSARHDRDDESPHAEACLEDETTKINIDGQDS